MVRACRQVAGSFDTSCLRRAPSGVVRLSSNGHTNGPAPSPNRRSRVPCGARLADSRGGPLSTRDGSCREGSRSSAPAHWRRLRARGTFSRALQHCAWPGPGPGGSWPRADYPPGLTSPARACPKRSWRCTATPGDQRTRTIVSPRDP